MNTPFASLTRQAVLGLLFVLAAYGPSPAASAQILGNLETDDRFGEVLAAGDFNNDGEDDLAVGVPDEGLFSLSGTLVGAGAVNVIYGTDSGLEEAGNQNWSQNSTGVGDVAEAGDHFGAALAVGDFDGDGYDDLAIGAPGEGYGSLTEVGQVHVLYGGDSGLTGSGSFYFPSVTGAQTGYRLGEALAAGDFNSGGYDDLAVGGPGRDLGNVTDAGLVAVLFGSPFGIRATGYQVWHQDVAGILDTAETGDQFGSALATGYFGDDDYDDLVVGVPYENIGSIVDAGAVNVLYGAASGLASAGNQFWNQNSPGIEDLAETGDRFGWALATGSFDSSFSSGIYEDLAIGVPYENVGTAADAGAVNVIYSGSGALSSADNELLHQDVDGVEGGAETGDQFGAALAAGYYLSGSEVGLAIGVPGEDDDGLTDIGYVYVIAGGYPGGLDPGYDQLWYQNSPGILGTSDPGDGFGRALAAGNFDGRLDLGGYQDLAVGVPDEDLSGFTDNGAVNVLYTYDGLVGADGNDFWYQGGTGTRLIEAESEEPSAAPEDASASAGIETTTTFALLPAAPNPFAGQTTLRFALPAPGAVRLTVYDALGRQVARLVDETLEAGEHAVAFDAGTLPSGTYLVRIEAGGQVQTQRLTRLR